MYTRILYTLTVLLISFVLVGCAMDAQASSPETLYPTVMQVIDMNTQENVLILVDFNGNTWEWEGIEDWAIGDIAGVIMDNNGTSNIYDDEILILRYCGNWGA